ncbi:flagellar export protein FliJ [Treponema sp. Marseille-Q4132]|uniref:flagellar export protein FliJ n=1 Tax=Treponema sp. Marseille-Q4132 TaxID=2766701 RepID=UPI0016532887|nr:flagellar export protein FliJ [Treponema sp. Marseille-Q4132]QNL97647.1 flagellar export protein FliJ [Treponema sp. Marseille-Q4132]
MKKFTFPLEDVMKYREYLQNEAELALGKAMAVEHDIQMRLDEVASQYAALAENMRGSTDFNDIARANDFYVLLDQQKDYLLEKMAEAKLVSEQRRKEMQDAMQKTEGLHKLRERQFDEYKDAEMNEANDIADDVTNARAARGRV